MKIIIAPNSILSQKAKPVKKTDKKLLEGMKKTLLSAKDPEGVGLAAPQVEIPQSIFIIKPAPKSSIRVFINPQISDEGGEVSKMETRKSPRKRLEGCLSLPNIWGEVKRKNFITLSFSDEKGKLHTKEFKGFLATIIQHEMDHLNGILFTERVLEQNGILYKSHKDKKGEAVFEELEI
ncbi:MAG: peptide deformylase [Candidatus Levybacteria bacterium RIFCSPLOWO2_01_FULL_38_13]|nr:MAG: peptide deformylase [Candidatus Levybacteria bacterium RIFCSPHIGHO2_01_FULL_41_15]OGH35723.1 MAG: peptide deformylase [Candidatus Levybacteria bacterium RIFCSPLOWO2_01_FULL_38_13]